MSGIPRWSAPVDVVRGALERWQPPAGEEVAFLGLGGNIGDRLHYLNSAVRLLHAHPRIVVDDISSVYETEPIGPSSDPYYNIAVRVLTDLAPGPLLSACQRIESTLGRERTVRWGARTIDIDILLYGDRVLGHRALTIPHPRLRERAFALVPLMEVAPRWRLPDGTTLARALADLVPITGIAAIGQQVLLEPRPPGPLDRA